MSIKDQIRNEVQRRYDFVVKQNQKNDYRSEMEKYIDIGKGMAYSSILFFIDNLLQQTAGGLIETVKEIDKKLGKDDWMEITFSRRDLIDFAQYFAKWGAAQVPIPEDTTIFQKGIEEGRRLERQDIKDGIQ